MNLLTKTMAGAAIGVGVLATSAVTASAAIVCSGNVCWHTHESYDYPTDAHIVVHEDDWKWGPREKYTFREHEGRGYWRGKAGRLGKIAIPFIEGPPKGRPSFHFGWSKARFAQIG